MKWLEQLSFYPMNGKSFNVQKSLTFFNHFKTNNKK